MNRVSDVIRSWLGRASNSPRYKTRTQTAPVPESRIAVASPPGPDTGSPATAAPGASRPVYQENIILVIVLVAGLFSLVDLRMLALAAVFSALLVYYDAGTLHAGKKFETESVLGDVVTWRPLTWAVCVLVIPLIFLAFYTFSRKEIFDANT